MENVEEENDMTNRERRDAGMAYISDDAVFEEQLVCRKILQKLNFMDRSDFTGIRETVKELFGKSVQGHPKDYGRRQTETIPRRGDRRGSMAGYSEADGI